MLWVALERVNSATDHAGTASNTVIASGRMELPQQKQRILKRHQEIATRR